MCTLVSYLSFSSSSRLFPCYVFLRINFTCIFRVLLCVFFFQSETRTRNKWKTSKHSSKSERTVFNNATTDIPFVWKSSSYFFFFFLLFHFSFLFYLFLVPLLNTLLIPLLVHHLVHPSSSLIENRKHSAKHYLVEYNKNITYVSLSYAVWCRTFSSSSNIPLLFLFCQIWNKSINCIRFENMTCRKYNINNSNNYNSRIMSDSSCN